jgi:hypothetical protein
LGLVIDENLEFMDVEVEDSRNLDYVIDEVDKYEPYEDDSNKPHTMPDADKWEGEAFDKFISAEDFRSSGETVVKTFTWNRLEIRG